MYMVIYLLLVLLQLDVPGLNRLLKKSFLPVIMSYPQKRVSSNILKRLDSRFHGNDGKRFKTIFKGVFQQPVNEQPPDKGNFR